MSDWQPEPHIQELYTQPAMDLAARITIKTPRSILDLGCGSGNSTAILARQWPDAHLTGLDNSPAMLEQAARALPQANFILRDAGRDLSDLGCFDIVFSCALLQWLPRHSPLIHRLYALLNPNGVLAVQIPHTEHMPAHRILKQMTSSVRWRTCLANVQGMRTGYSMAYYYNILSKLPGHGQLWQTTYLHVVDNHSQLLHWFSALRPYLNALGDLREKFVAEYEYNLSQAYHRQADKKILFPFSNLFFILQKNDSA